MNDAIKAQVSAFVDGELPSSELELLLRRMSQDAELRQLAAEYLAIRRVMRGERQVTGLGDLRNRIAAAIDDQEIEQEIDNSQRRGRAYVKPMAGVAIAATVALAAIFGLQQMNGIGDEQQPDAVVDVEEAYTVPGQIEDQLQEYYRRHASSASNLDARFATMELPDSVLVEIEAPPVEDGEETEEQTENETPRVE